MVPSNSTQPNRTRFHIIELTGSLGLCPAYYIIFESKMMCHDVFCFFVFIFFFHLSFFLVYFIALFFRSCLCCCVLVPGTLTFHFDTWICDLILFFGLPLSRSLWPHNQYQVYLSRIGNQDGNWMYWWSWVERTISCEDNNNNNHNLVKVSLPCDIKMPNTLNDVHLPKALCVSEKSSCSAILHFFRHLVGSHCTPTKGKLAPDVLAVLAVLIMVRT